MFPTEIACTNGVQQCIELLTLAKMGIPVTISPDMDSLEQQMLEALATILSDEGVAEPLVDALLVMYKADRLPTADVVAQLIRDNIEDKA